MGRRKKHLNSDETMKMVLEILKDRLDTLDDIKYINNVFVQGELSGYRTCIKKAMTWENAREVWGKEYHEWDVTMRSGLRINPFHTIKSKRQRALENYEKRKNKSKIKNADIENSDNNGE